MAAKKERTVNEGRNLRRLDIRNCVHFASLQISIRMYVVRVKTQCEPDQDYVRPIKHFPQIAREKFEQTKPTENVRPIDVIGDILELPKTFER